MRMRSINWRSADSGARRAAVAAIVRAGYNSPLSRPSAGVWHRPQGVHQDAPGAGHVSRRRAAARIGECPAPTACTVVGRVQKRPTPTSQEGSPNVAVKKTVKKAAKAAKPAAKKVAKAAPKKAAVKKQAVAKKAAPKKASKAPAVKKPAAKPVKKANKAAAPAKAAVKKASVKKASVKKAAPARS